MPFLREVGLIGEERRATSEFTLGIDDRHLLDFRQAPDGFVVGGNPMTPARGLGHRILAGAVRARHQDGVGAGGPGAGHDRGEVARVVVERRTGSRPLRVTIANDRTGDLGGLRSPRVAAALAAILDGNRSGDSAVAYEVLNRSR